VTITSLMAMGTPASGGKGSPLSASASTFAAAAIARSFESVRKERISPSSAAILR
jgi:hypothetical protein